MVDKEAFRARTIPKRAAALVDQLCRDQPGVVTRNDIATYLSEYGDQKHVTTMVKALQRLGWLATTHSKGVWVFVPPGESKSNDPYLNLKTWRAREPGAVFALAGEAAAWHLGYIKRRFDGLPAVWVPHGTRLPHGLRSHLSIVRIDWNISDPTRLGPSPKLLRKRGLDLTSWAGGVPALGPEALLIQLAARPNSFRSWADLINQLDELVADCDIERLVELLPRKSTSVWQRAAYLFMLGGRRDDGISLLSSRPERHFSDVKFGEGPNKRWSKDFKVVDYFAAHLKENLGKA